MTLPDFIEVIPLTSLPTATITVPGSKSITNRALILAALGEGETVLKGALWSEDTQVMVECLQELGFMVQVQNDPREPANRTVAVYGKGGKVPRGGSITAPLELFVGNAGTAARFLAAMLCLGEGTYRLHGVPRMHERPQAALFDALRQLGYTIDSSNDRLPAVIHGTGPRPGRCTVSVAESSQFASALLLAAKVGGWNITTRDADEDEMPYVAMTQQLVESFSGSPGELVIEPDASSGSYFWATNALFESPQILPKVRVTDWPRSGWQIDARYPDFLKLPTEVSRRHDLADSIMTAIVVAPWSKAPVRFTDLGRLRVQECERVHALRNELNKCGAAVEERGDTLTVHPSILHGAEIETYQDHRMAMCFAILGLKVPGIKLKNPACVNKTFPNFFQKLAAHTPHGLGASFAHGHTGRRLAYDDLAVD